MIDPNELTYFLESANRKAQELYDTKRERQIAESCFIAVAYRFKLKCEFGEQDPKAQDNKLFPSN